MSSADNYIISRQNHIWNVKISLQKYHANFVESAQSQILKGKCSHKKIYGKITLVKMVTQNKKDSL